MSEQSERKRILQMLASGQINAQEAEELLGVLEEDHVGGSQGEDNRTVSARLARRHGPNARPRIGRSLRILIRSGVEGRGGNGNVSVTIPLGLAKFAGRLLPEDARTRLDDEGIDIVGLLDALDDDLPEGKLLDIDAGDGADKAHIVVEVV